MRSIQVLVISTFVLFSTATTTHAQKVSVDSLAWMAGCWELSARSGAMLISEQWMKPAGGTLIGMSRTVRKGKLSGWEFLRIAADDDGGASYIARPSSNKDETAFKSTKASATEITFENLQHDFPQRIIYRNTGPDTLFARVEGTRDGKVSGSDIPMKRVKCE